MRTQTCALRSGGLLPPTEIADPLQTLLPDLRGIGHRAAICPPLTALLQLDSVLRPTTWSLDRLRRQFAGLGEFAKRADINSDLSREVGQRDDLIVEHPLRSGSACLLSLRELGAELPQLSLERPQRPLCSEPHKPVGTARAVVVRDPSRHDAGQATATRPRRRVERVLSDPGRRGGRWGWEDGGGLRWRDGKVKLDEAGWRG